MGPVNRPGLPPQSKDQAARRRTAIYEKASVSLAAPVRLRNLDPTRPQVRAWSPTVFPRKRRLFFFFSGPPPPASTSLVTMAAPSNKFRIPFTTSIPPLTMMTKSSIINLTSPILFEQAPGPVHEAGRPGRIVPHISPVWDSAPRFRVDRPIPVLPSGPYPSTKCHGRLSPPSAVNCVAPGPPVGATARETAPTLACPASPDWTQGRSLLGKARRQRTTSPTRWSTNFGARTTTMTVQNLVIRFWSPFQ